MKLQLSLSDTNVLKGIALLLLLAHHLFYVRNGLYDDISISSDRFLFNEIGKWGKVCVAIFVFLSGYGLMVNAMKTGGVTSITRFYWHRFVKLMINYWFIWLIFVPIGVFIFDRTLSDVYGPDIIPDFILDFLGVLSCTGKLGYNPTWWFYSCIIALYLSFPLLYKMLDRFPMMLIPFVLILYYLPTTALLGIRVYFVSFVLGMMLCKYGNISKGVESYIWIVLFVLLSVQRMFVSDVFIFDAAITLSLVMSYKSLKIPSIIEKVFSFLGRHSMNIFLFHTFIYYYWFPEYIYSSRNPLCIWLFLLLVCIIISLILELMKKLLHVNAFIKKIDSLYVVSQTD